MTNREAKERKLFWILFFIFYLVLLVSVANIEVHVWPGILSLEFIIVVVIAGIGFLIMMRFAERIDRFAKIDDDEE